MKLFDGGFVFLLIFTVFGYLTYQVDSTTDGGTKKIDVAVIKEEIKDDYQEVREFLASGSSANHDRYND